MGTLRQGYTDTRSQRLRLCKNSSTFKEKDAHALKHRNQGQTETKTWKKRNTEIQGNPEIGIYRH